MFAIRSDLSRVDHSLYARQLRPESASRRPVDPNAVKLLNLYPDADKLGSYQQLCISPNLYEHTTRSTSVPITTPPRKNQIFFRFSYADDPQYHSGHLRRHRGRWQLPAGHPDCEIRSGRHRPRPTSSHPTTINVVRGGFNHLHTTRFGPEGDTAGIPAQYGIQGIPQVPENGGLPGV